MVSCFFCVSREIFALRSLRSNLAESPAPRQKKTDPHGGVRGGPCLCWFCKPGVRGERHAGLELLRPYLHSPLAEARVALSFAQESVRDTSTIVAGQRVREHHNHRGYELLDCCCPVFLCAPVPRRDALKFSVRSH